MFYNCSNLTSLDLTSFSNDFCQQCGNIFEGCYNMTLYMNPYKCRMFAQNIPEYVNPIFIYDFF